MTDRDGPGWEFREDARHLLLVRDGHQGLQPGSDVGTRKAFASAVDNAVMESADAHQNQMNQVLSNKNVAADFGRIVFDLLVAQSSRSWVQSLTFGIGRKEAKVKRLIS
jgi:hypothetical protein